MPRLLKQLLPPALLMTLALCLLAACGSDEGVDADGHTPATDFTVERNAAVARSLDLDDPQDFENARRGLIASDEDLVIAGPQGKPVWNMPDYGFIKGKAPDTVNPSLWRQEQLINLHGLFEVVEGVYQLRGYDISNMTVIRGQQGWIVVDPLLSAETAARAMDLVHRHLGERPVSAVIYTHSHADHFGGVQGVLTAETATKQRVPIIAPEGFMEEATSENMLAGLAMSRRAMFMYGTRLARSPRGHIGAGLGKGPSQGTIGILEPTLIVDSTPQKLTLDGVDFVFQNAPGTEAPAELTFYLPKHRLYSGADNLVPTLHNLYTLRGAQVRDAMKWVLAIDEVIDLFGEAEIFMGSHGWPLWGKAEVRDYLESQRDLYKFIHDQTLRHALNGLTPGEIAEAIVMPQALQRRFSSRGYYGTVKHNARAVYQRYFGWYDANPAHLDPLPPVEAAQKYVDFMGGAAALLDKARGSFEQGDYRWTAEVLNHLVFAEPDNGDARELLAATYDQLGYRAESAPWRDVYLSGAYELRHGPPETGMNLSNAMGLLRHTPMERFLDAMAIRLNADKADGKALVINLHFTDLQENHVLRLKNSVLHHRQQPLQADADATLHITRELYLKMATGQAGLKDTLFSDDLEIDGSRLKLLRFFGLFDKPKGVFNIVEP